MPENDLSLLITAAQKAGEIAGQFTGTEAQKWDKPDGAGPVTEADLAVSGERGAALGQVTKDRLGERRPLLRVG